jgi:acyl-CoA thioesterase
MPAAPKPSVPLRNFLRLNIPYWTTIGMEVLETELDTATVRVRYHRGLLNSNGVVHGGVVFSAADAAIAVALLSLLKGGERIATIEMKINFVRAVKQEDVIAEARILHRGSRTAVGEATVHDGAGRLAAKGLATYAITPPRSKNVGVAMDRMQKRRPLNRR